MLDWSFDFAIMFTNTMNVFVFFLDRMLARDRTSGRKEMPGKEIVTLI